MRTKKYLEVAKGDATHLKVELYYTKGGMNYFTGKTEARGIFLSVTPVKRSTDGKYASESYTAFTGIKKHVLDMARFNQKKFDAFVVDPAIEKQLIDYVCEKNGIILKENLEETV